MNTYSVIFNINSGIVCMLFLISSIPLLKIAIKKNNDFLPLVELQILFFFLIYFLIFFIPEKILYRSYKWLLNGSNEFFVQNFFWDFKDKMQFTYILLVSLGILFFLSGSTLARFFFQHYLKKYVNKFDFNYFLEFKIIFNLGIIFFIFTFFIYSFNNLFTSKLLDNYKTIFPLFSSMCLSYCYLSRYKFYISIFILFIIFIFIFIISISQIIPILILLILILNNWMIKKKISVFLILFSIFFIFYTQDIKIFLRTNGINKISKIENTKLFFNNIYENKSEKKNQIFQNDLNEKTFTSLVRISIHAVAFRKILDQNKNNDLLFLYGESYKFLTFFYIPRFLWKDKPKNAYGPLYGKASKIIEKNNNTSINVAWISEAYWNFENFFVVAIFVKGFLISIISILISYKRNLLLYFAGIPSFVNLAIPESNFSLMFSQSIISFLFLLLVLFIINKYAR